MQQANDNTTTIIRAVFFVAVFLIAAGTVVFLKHESDDGPLTPENIAARDSLRNIAKPDTDDPTSEDVSSTFVTSSDSLDTDVRLPADAGYEDGYYAGITDGVSGDERASYDDSSRYPSAEDRRTYTDAYKRGYVQGYQDGQDGKQFGISTDDYDDENENENEN